MMKAIVNDAYGSPDELEVQEVDKPALHAEASSSGSARLRSTRTTGT